ncbi:MAG TPA: hypothetical protein VJG29_00615 [Candidatus Paceibacterota bacterium]
MLNPFPDLLFLGILAPTVLRIAAGLLFLWLSLRHVGQRESVGASLPSFLKHIRVLYAWALVIAEMLVAIALIAGFLTQIAALLGLLGVIKAYFLRARFPHIFPLSGSSYFLLATILFVLIFTGAGAFGFDIPL